MILNELMHNHTWETISVQFLKSYPEAKNNLEGYKMVFEKLKEMDPKSIAMAIVISKETDIIDGDYFIDVAGIYNHPKSLEEKYPQGIEFLPWCQWLGMEISKDSLINFSEPEILVHCFYEMTYVSLSEEDIQKAIHRER
ncbi:DUF6557 family protein [Aequorivita marisscotiae]|uniref:Uncharacterized protein n=1 Tax=Aequorivita marisscotiae TaxID=3040348 RepID=A0ABY8KUC0_9FLAO|nr:DUF6557 family protein [Aequorivita sp. Ant34-E75]WGF92642.1 hypothetical protein QCQ61_00275 [Aequorivita sp. Ant34-E75]